MDSENFFQQKVNIKGETEFRTRFGRHKALVFRKHRDFSYIDLYDNRPLKICHIGLGMDELDVLLTMRTNLNALKTGLCRCLIGSRVKICFYVNQT